MLRPVVESSDLAEANQHITNGVSQGITELNTSQQHIRWPTSNQRNVKLIKNLLFPKGNSVKRLSRKLWTHSQLSSTHLTLKESILRAYLQAKKYPRILQMTF
ncbi:hypothetical protein PoB_006097300 [Plakobranchus ocellatus]|uniref:Uncharacterized protein n=1 Tax=Plakobranchus ocellatus TaxID=259542 RepID=A0AAV4CRC3_9GAST|nr:hypothetical protein PoB_006097300 [Plakobranchus ocellatus]